MKPQDLMFFVLFLVIIALKGKWSWHAAMSLFALAGILFLVGNLFTAQLFTWYAAALMGVACITRAIRSLPRHE